MSETPSPPPAAETDVSCSLPLLFLFLAAAVWLMMGSAFGLVASIKFHSPTFLANAAWLTYGRVHPACVNSMLYGFCLPAGLGVGLWLLASLGRAALAQPWLVVTGAAFWNLGLFIGILGILAGDSTAFENLELPRYSARILLLSFLMIGLWGVLTFHRRRERSLFVSQWFVLAALFWFPWIYSTAQLLLVAFPVRGVAQAVIAWWYSANLQTIWLGLVGLGTLFYFVPKLADRQLNSHYLALFAFWGLILCGGWTGIPNTAPVPAWMPTLSTIATVLMIVPVIAFALNAYQTPASGHPCPQQQQEQVHSSLPCRYSFSFIRFGVAAFVAAGFLKTLFVSPGLSQVLSLTWAEPALTHLHNYGFFLMAMFGAIYYIVPLITGLEFPSLKLVRLHFWLAAFGTLLIVIPLAIGGVLEGLRLQNPNVAFVDIAKGTLPFLRASTTGDLLIAFGHIAFLFNLAALVARLCRLRAASTYAAVTADIKAAEVPS